MTGQTPLFDDMDLFGYEQVDITEAITDAHEEQRAAIERAAAAVKAEKEQAARDAEGIRAMIGATLPAGAGDRWTATLGATVEPIADDQDAEEPGPWGVFEEGLCIAAVDSRAVADQLAAEAIAADDGDSEVVVLPLCVEHIDDEQPRRTCEECAADGSEEETGEDDEDSAPEVDLDALQMTPMVRRMVVDLDGRRWHYQTRKGAFDKGLVTDIKAAALTEFGEQVRAALLAE